MIPFVTGGEIADLNSKDKWSKPVQAAQTASMFLGISSQMGFSPDETPK
jgi:hypothetical protein